MQHRKFLFVLAAVVGVFSLAPAIAIAADYPSKAIRLIVPFPPGGTADIVARLVSAKLATSLSVPVVVDNRAGGAGGSVGTVEIMRAIPDGYTVGIATVGTLGTAPAVAKKPPYDPDQNFSYIVNLGQTPMLLAAGPSITAKNFPELLAEIRKQAPNTTAFASGGSGGVAHLMGAKFQLATATKLTHVPYRGAIPAINDVVAGQVGLVFDALTSSTSFIQGGRLRAFAISGSQRTASLPNVPTFTELGLQGVNTEAWYGLIGPAGLPPEVVDKLSIAVRRVLADPDLVEKFRKLDTEVVGGSPQQFRKQVIDELARWRQLAATEKIVLD